MSNIERRYAYLDEGVFPEEGEYGVTYLTLYSSNAGNIYDGWVYDPYNRVRESFTERTYGYRNPDYPQYCWDDEVVVDLSNAQSRQESSEFAQGRITSFNTNVSDRPIILQDIDITGLTEEERESKATTVLFSAIPLVQDAYIQAQVEVQCKVNLSPDNTTGIVRVEAFYILNDESDRTMRPNPVHTFSVSSDNERHTLPWLYWNPALRHDDHNYIGVKLIATGGTVEIGISDDPEYGDAMITLASAGLTGDHIDSGRPVALEIFGKEEVVGGYELDINDYTVLCTYDTGEIYEVTRMCTFNPAMGTPIEQAFTTLTAYYMGLSASMTIRLGMVESIELSGLDYFHNKLKLKLNDYTVLAYIDTGDIMDVTGECTFSPAMGTTITSDTTLTATYSPFWMHGASFTDSMQIEQVEVVGYGGASDPEDGLVYTLYSDGRVIITGNATHPDARTGAGMNNETIQLPASGTTPQGQSFDMREAVETSGYTLEWDAEGKISGFKTIAYNDKYLCKGFINFDDVEITRVWEDTQDPSAPSDNHIYFDFCNERDLTSNMLRWCANVDNTPVRRISSDKENLSSMFSGCKALTDVNFMLSWNIGGNKTLYMFKNCISLKNIDGLANMNMSLVTDATEMFSECHQLETISGSSNWNVGFLITANWMFKNCESLTHLDALFFWRPDRLSYLGGMFYGVGASHISGVKNWDKSSWRDITNLVNYSKIIDLDGLQGLDFTVLDDIYYNLQPTKQCIIHDCPELVNLNGCEDWVLASNSLIQFKDNPKLTDISAVSEWDTSSMKYMDSMFEGSLILTDISPVSSFDLSSAETAKSMFARCSSLTDLSPLSDLDVSNIEYFDSMFAYCLALSNLQPLSNWVTSSAKSMVAMFSNDDEIRYIGCLSGWNVMNILPYGSASPYIYGGINQMFNRSNADRENNFENTHILDADSLNWNVPTRSVQAGEEPLWQCTIVNPNVPSIHTTSGIFPTCLYGTDYPVRDLLSTPLSWKLYNLPYWYYHNTAGIDETR